MFKMTTLARLAALGASAAITFSVVALLAGYGLPQDSGEQILAQAAPVTATQSAK